MKKKRSKRYLVTALGVLSFLYIFFGAPQGGSEPVSASAAAVTGTPTPTPLPKLVSIGVSYSGMSKVVGSRIDKSELEVTAFYEDGTTAVVPDSDYALSEYVVSQEGYNTILVIYRTQTATFGVIGKKIQNIAATCTRNLISIGNAVDKRDLSVLVTYTDGSYDEVRDYIIANGTIVKEGAQTVRIIYSGVSTDVTVFGTAAKTISSITAFLEKESVVAGVRLDPLDFTVTAVYKDGSTERITNFALSTTILNEEGSYNLVISYHGFSTVVEVKCIPRSAVSVRAVYDRSTVMIGGEVDRKRLKVYATFIDGKEEQVEDYIIYSPIIRYIGENTVRIYYQDVQTEITIVGTQYIAPSFDYIATYKVTNGTDTAIVNAAIPVTMATDGFFGESVQSGNLKKIYRRLGIKDGKYIGLTMEFKDPDDEAELPLAVRISIPDGFKIEDTYLYYTPNLRTIVGRMNKTQISDTVFETTIFKAGTYILVYAPDLGEEE